MAGENAARAYYSTMLLAGGVCTQASVALRVSCWSCHDADEIDLTGDRGVLQLAASHVTHHMKHVGHRVHLFHLKLAWQC